MTIELNAEHLRVEAVDCPHCGWCAMRAFSTTNAGDASWRDRTLEVHEFAYHQLISVPMSARVIGRIPLP